ncbi:MAG: holo-ACP synthase [Longimicrobiales bacterium]
MIIGIGIDVVDCDRLDAFHRRHGERGLRRLFTPAELSYCLELAHVAPSLAARFAAKEAFFKALGTGWGVGGSWTDVEVRREMNGRPVLALHGRAQAVARERGAQRAFVSLSHTAGLALAQVMLEA